MQIGFCFVSRLDLICRRRCRLDLAVDSVYLVSRLFTPCTLYCNSYHITSHHITPYLTSYYIISHCTTSYHIIPYHITRYHIISLTTPLHITHRIISHCTTSYNISHHTTSSSTGCLPVASLIITFAPFINYYFRALWRTKKPLVLQPGNQSLIKEEKEQSAWPVTVHA